MPKYKVRIKYPEDNSDGWKDVDGLPITIPELDGIKLFIHRPIRMGLFPTWNISEKKTGLSLIDGCEGTKKDAIQDLQNKAILNPQLREFILETIEQIISRG